jgi:hypothetical protein
MVGFDYVNTKEVSVTQKLNLPVLTTTQRDALTTTNKGDLIYNSTESQPEVYDGSDWGAIGGGGGAIGMYQLDTGSPALTITSNTITVNSNYSYYEIDSEETFPVEEDVNTISGGTEGQIIILKPTQTISTIINIIDGTGNISLASDFAMNNATNSTLTLIARNISGFGIVWRELSRN